MKIGLIVAYSPGNVIGYQNKLPWRIKEEILLFKKITTDNIIIMGRNTYDSIGKPLENRLNFVITSKEIRNDRAYTFNSVESCLDFCKKLNLNKKVLLIGGGSLYNYFLKNNYVDYMYISKIKQTYQGDTYFPKLDEDYWKKTIYHKSDFFDTWLYTL